MTCTEFRAWLDGLDAYRCDHGQAIIPTPTGAELSALAAHLWECDECHGYYLGVLRQRRTFNHPLGERAYQSGVHIAQAALRDPECVAVLNGRDKAA